MKVFISHSSQQSAFVDKLRRACPESIKFWIDEKDIKKGQNFKTAIDRALADGFVFCVLIVDDNAAKSPWVRYEIEKVLEREKDEGQELLIPVVLSEGAWKELAPLIGEHRNFIRCFDQQDDSITLAASRLTRSIFEWLIERETKRGQHKAGEGASGAYASAESTMTSAASALKNAIYTFRQRNPATIKEIFARVSHEFPELFSNEAEVRKALTDLTRQGDMPGYYFDGEIAFVVNERYEDKSEIKTKIKQKIGKLAAQYLADNLVVSIDGGTTTLELANELCNLLRAEALFGLKVITNSLPVAEKLIHTLALRRAGDRDATCKIVMMGGSCRATTLSTTFDEHYTSLRDLLGQVDVAFVGASGLVGAQGFGVTNLPEVAAKTGFQECAARTVMVCDANKFEVSQVRLTNPPGPNMAIVTERAADARLKELAKENPAWGKVDVKYCD